MAREGKEIERKARIVMIYNIKITKFLPPDRFETVVDCTKGTYIRTLCSDIGKMLGCGAHMESLLRTETSGFTLENAITLDTLKQMAENGQVEKALLSMTEALSIYPKAIVSEKWKKMLYNGGKIYEHAYQCPQHLQVGDTVTVFDSNKNLVGLYEVQKEKELLLKPLKMLI